MARLIIMTGERKGAEIRLAAERCTIGRLDRCEIPIPDRKASRAHARLFQSEGAYFIVDLNSQNGTRVNEEPITRFRLRDGDKIRIGMTEFEFREERSASRAPIPSVAAPVMSTPPARQEPRPTPDDIELRGAPLQYSKYKNDHAGSVLREDLAQSGGVFRVVALIMAIVVLVGAAIGTAWLMLNVL